MLTLGTRAPVTMATYCKTMAQIVKVTHGNPRVYIPLQVKTRSRFAAVVTVTETK